LTDVKTSHSKIQIRPLRVKPGQYRRPQGTFRETENGNELPKLGNVFPGAKCNGHSGPLPTEGGLLLFSSAGLDELGAPLYGIIIYLQCQIAVLRSNAEKQRFKFLIVSAPAARLSFAAAQRKYLRDLSALCHGEGL
jgi:hypothetical protein